MLYKHIPGNTLTPSLFITPGESYLFIEADVTAGSADVAAGASTRAGNGDENKDQK